ncbi:MAG: glycosyltransferase, partial [Pseudomonadota bacterium]
RLGGFNTAFQIAADYDFILRYFSQARGRSVYIPQVLYKMRLGGISNRNLAKIRLKMGEDLRALRENNVGSYGALMMKNISKLGQFRTSKST